MTVRHLKIQAEHVHNELFSIQPDLPILLESRADLMKDWQKLYIESDHCHCIPFNWPCFFNNGAAQSHSSRDLSVISRARRISAGYCKAQGIRMIRYRCRSVKVPRTQMVPARCCQRRPILLRDGVGAGVAHSRLPTFPQMIHPITRLY